MSSYHRYYAICGASLFRNMRNTVVGVSIQHSIVLQEKEQLSRSTSSLPTRVPLLQLGEYNSILI